MSHFMRDSKHVAERGLIVQENKWMHTGDARRICAAALAFGLFDVYLALVVTFF